VNRAPEVHNVRQRRQRKTAAVVGHRHTRRSRRKRMNQSKWRLEDKLVELCGPREQCRPVRWCARSLLRKADNLMRASPGIKSGRPHSIPSPLTPSFQALNLPFLQILPTIAFLSWVSSPGLITWIPQTVYFTSKHIRFYFLVFFWFTLFSCCFRAV